MKHVFSYLVLPLVCFFFASELNAASYDVRSLDANNNGVYESCEVNENTCVQSGPCTCYCPVTRFRPVNYCETKCVQEPYTCEKKCCRYVDECYSKKCCRKVPQYYDKQCCRMVPECYTKTCCRMVQVPQYYEKQCTRMVPQYYTVQCCRQVNEYYDEPCTRKVPQYYTVCETKYRNKYVKEPKCRYEPYTCMETRCINAPMDSCCAAASSASAGQYRAAPAQQAVAPAQQAAAYRNAPSAQGLNNQVALSNSLTAPSDQSIVNTIQTKIEKANLLDKREHVSVSFNSGTLTLSGVVLTPAKKQQIESLVSGFNGINRIDNQITIGSTK